MGIYVRCFLRNRRNPVPAVRKLGFSPTWTEEEFCPSLDAQHTPENIKTQIFVCLSIAWRADNAISYRDVCRAWQILRLCQAYLFLTFPRGFTHTSKLSNAFYGHFRRFLACSRRDTHSCAFLGFRRASGIFGITS